MDAKKLVCSVVGCLTRMVYGGEFRKIRVSVSFIHQKHMSLTFALGQGNNTSLSPISLGKMVLPMLTILPGSNASIVYQGELQSAFQGSGTSFAEIVATVSSVGSNNDVQILDLKSKMTADKGSSLHQQEAMIHLHVECHEASKQYIADHLEKSMRHFTALYISCSKLGGGETSVSVAQMPLIELQLGQGNPVKIQCQASPDGSKLDQFFGCSKLDTKHCFWSTGHSSCCFEFGGTMWSSLACLAVHIDSGSTSRTNSHVEHILWYDSSSMGLKDTEKILSKCSWSRHGGFTFRSKPIQGMSIVKHLKEDGHDGDFVASIREIIVYIYPKFQCDGPEMPEQVASTPATVIRDSVNASLHGVKSIMTQHASNPDPINLIVESLTGVLSRSKDQGAQDIMLQTCQAVEEPMNAINLSQCLHEKIAEALTY